MKKGLILALGLIFALVFIINATNVSAGIYFSQLESVYNIGDTVDMNVSINPLQDGPLKLKLVCSGNSIDIFNGPPIENIVLPLNSKWIGNLKGDCYFLAEYAGDSKKTNPTFQISDKLDVKFSIDSFFAKPDEVILLKGNVKKLNGKTSNGEVEINIPFSGAIINQNSSVNNTVNNSLQSNLSGDKFYGKISNGEFSVSLRLPGNIPAGDYNLQVSAYELSDSWEKTNKGETTGSLKVPQILKNIDVAISNQNFNPGDNVSIKPVLLDQSGLAINDQISIVITNTEAKSVYERVIGSGETGIFEIPIDLPSGYYTVKISSGDKDVVKNFFVAEKPKIFFEIRNDTLYVKNIGNARYIGDVQIEINGKPFVKKVDLGVGEDKNFYLSGKDGTYDIKAKAGDSEIEQKGVSLTGHAIDVSDSKNKDYLNVVYTPILWIFVIIILTAGIIFLLRNVLKKKSFAYPRDKRNRHDNRDRHLKLHHVMKTNTIEKPKEVKKEVFRKIILAPSLPPTKAEQGFVSTGHRNRATIIGLKIKNKITKFSKEAIEKVLEPAFDKKAAVLEQGEYVFIVLSPLVTKTFKNEVDAAKLAEQISTNLREHNLKFKDNVEFGIAVNSGEILNEVKDGRLLFTALGSSLLGAKRLSELSKGEVLLSKEVYEKSMGEIKAEKKSVNGNDYYEMKKIVDYEKNKKFIDDFLKRSEKDKKGLGKY
jgi:hypothetical protein